MKIWGTERRPSLPRAAMASRASSSPSITYSS